MSKTYTLYFVAHVEDGDNYDLFVVAPNPSAAASHWRTYFGRTDQPATIWEVPQEPFLKPGPLGWRTFIKAVAQVGPVLH